MSIAIGHETEVDLPDRYEVINGEIVEVPPMSWFASEVANRLRDELGAFAQSSSSGRSRSDMLFHVPFPEDPTRNRRPDVAFISYDRWPRNRALPYRGNAADVVPDLIVEVASPTDEAEELLIKVNQYLEAGVRLVWVVYPKLHILDAYESKNKPHRFFEEDELTGGPVLPGFKVAMSTLFPEFTGGESPDEE
jgi:Uma2 family endonuclease